MRRHGEIARDTTGEERFLVASLLDMTVFTMRLDMTELYNALRTDGT
jgi:hypothetical protein